MSTWNARMSLQAIRQMKGQVVGIYRDKSEAFDEYVLTGTNIFTKPRGSNRQPAYRTPGRAAAHPYMSFVGSMR